MQKHYDACGFIGNWPFRKLHKGKLSDLMAVHMENSISGGLVGCLDSVFFNDPYEGDEECAAMLKGSPYLFAGTVNPTLPGAEEDLYKYKNKLGAAAIRLYPSDHSYSCDDSRVISLCRLAGKLGLRVVITVRTEDIRLDYLFKQTGVSIPAIMQLCESCPDTKFLISNIYIGEVFSVSGQINSLPNVWVDMSRFNHLLFTADKAVEQIKPEKLVFGSCFPLLSLKCMLLNIETSLLSDDIKDMMLGGNFEDFIK
ncbi:hypothetical protein SDC9_116856 [bioreactor metagenome]|uniref:Amidohydrolase-related domain-containing protein n=1 Tax=bioreactor metagenome TaxID=1076179 RepID=A0A645BXS5_9ZZZZ|nr:hypothetical protein [Oscillospiraceae bacterium]